MNLRQKVALAFQAQFKTKPALLVRAPGRVNLIGEYTDYNDGFVLPMAIDRAVWIALRPHPDRSVCVHSLDYNQTVEFSLDDLQKGTGWADYLKGVAWAMQVEDYRLQGWEGVLMGDVPRAAGLSSSAAVEIAAACAFAAISDRSAERSRRSLGLAPAKMAQLGQKAENQWIGVNCGIMDQMVSAAAKAGHALFLDCRSLEYQHIPLPSGMAVAVLDTGTRRGLVDSAYNERRLQCESAARLFGVRALRDVDLATFRSRAAELDPITLRRTRHVVSEDARVLQAVDAMRRGDALALGELLNASHASLRDDFEVSSDALNQMVEVARQHSACYGARMTGAGFGGCAVALVKKRAAIKFATTTAENYSRRTGLKPSVYICKAAEGASIEEI